MKAIVTILCSLFLITSPGHKDVHSSAKGETANLSLPGYSIYKERKRLERNVYSFKYNIAAHLNERGDKIVRVA